MAQAKKESLNDGQISKQRKKKKTKNMKEKIKEHKEKNGSSKERIIKWWPDK